MENMFSGDSLLAQVIVGNCWSIRTKASKEKGISLESQPMFVDCFNLVGGNGTKFNHNEGKATIGILAMIDSIDAPGYFTPANRNDLPLELQQYGFNVAKLNYKDKSEGIFQHVVVADFDKNTGKRTAKFLIQGCYFNNRSQPTFTIPGLAGWTTISGGTDVECRGGDEVEYS